MELRLVSIENPDAHNILIGQSHFVKTVEDLHEALVTSVPDIRFGVAFCEASGACLVRHSGTDPHAELLAVRNAEAIGAGHSFVIVLANAYPINVLDALRRVPELCTIFCATANPLSIVVAETPQGRGILGVIDGGSPKGVEGEDGVAWRRGFLRKIGYKA